MTYKTVLYLKENPGSPFGEENVMSKFLIHILKSGLVFKQHLTIVVINDVVIVLFISFCVQ